MPAMPETWTSQNEPLQGERGQRFTLNLADRKATVAEVLRAWQHDASFRSLFGKLLADAPYEAFRWETPTVTADTLSRPFEFVLLDDPGLDRRPDVKAFA